MRRLPLLLVAVLAGLAAYLVVSSLINRNQAPITIQPQPPGVDYINPGLGGPAPGEPEWVVQVQLERTGSNQHRFHFKVREKHGWAANGIYVAFWHRSKDPSTGEWVKDSRETNVLCASSWLRFGETLEYSTTVAIYEFPELKDFGTTENWAARVASYSDLTAPK